MSDEPTPRAVFNVKAVTAFTILGFAMFLTWWGLTNSQLEAKDAILPWIGAAIGSGTTWLAGK